VNNLGGLFKKREKRKGMNEEDNKENRNDLGENPVKGRKKKFLSRHKKSFYF